MSTKSSETAKGKEKRKTATGKARHGGGHKKLTESPAPDDDGDDAQDPDYAEPSVHSDKKHTAPAAAAAAAAAPELDWEADITVDAPYSSSSSSSSSSAPSKKPSNSKYDTSKTTVTAAVAADTTPSSSSSKKRTAAAADLEDHGAFLGAAKDPPPPTTKKSEEKKKAVDSRVFVQPAARRAPAELYRPSSTTYEYSRNECNYLAFLVNANSS